MVNTGDVPHPVYTPNSSDCVEKMAGLQGSRPQSPTSQHLSSEESEEQLPGEEDKVREMNQEIEEAESRECSKEEDDNSEISFRSNSTGCDDTQPLDVTSEREQCADATEESLQREEDSEGDEASDCVEEMLSCYQKETQGQEDYQESPLEEGEGEEEQLCELVLKLRTTLSLPTNTGLWSECERELLYNDGEITGDDLQSYR